MSEIDVLDFATTADVSDNTDNTESTDSTETEQNDQSGPSAIYGNVVGTYSESSLAGADAPTYNGKTTLTVTDFAAFITVQNIQEKLAKGETPGSEDMVDRQRLYIAVRAARSPLPVVLVYPDGVEHTVENQKDAKVFVPSDEAVKAWSERPVRGEGTSKSGRSDADLLDDAAKKFLERESNAKRLAKLQEKVNKINAQYDKYLMWAKDRGFTPERVETRANEIAAEREAEAAQNESTENAEAPANA